MFVNMLPLRAELAGDPSSPSCWTAPGDTVLDAFDHADLPFEQLVNELACPGT